jgi:serine/threonine protein kinase
MTLEQLRRFLSRDPGVDLEALHAQWREQGRADDSGFLDFLASQKVIEPWEADAIRSATTGVDPSRDASASGGKAGNAPPGVLSRKRFEIGRVLGKGGMATVHEAADSQLNRSVAFKQLSSDLVTMKGLTARFHREIQITAQLDHPGIVPVHAVVESSDDGAPAYVMKLVRGETLGDTIQRTRELFEAGRPIPEELSLESRLDAFLGVCDAVDFAHTKGVLHRDLKPANIMVGAFHEVYVMDWGLARVLGRPDDADGEAEGGLQPAGDDAGVEQTQVGEIMGTPAYMSPEQASGLNDEIGPRSDQYSLGLILHELVSLRAAVPGDTYAKKLGSAMQGKVAALQHVAPKKGIPAELAKIIKKATATTPEDRYPTVAALADDLRHHLRNEQVAALPDNAARGLARWLSHHRSTTLILLALAATLAASSFAWSLYRQQADAIAARAREQRLGSFVADVGRQGLTIDTTLRNYETLLEGLATAAGSLLMHAAPGGEPVYFDTDFTQPGTAPPDLRDSSSYGGKVSVGHAAIKLAPGIKPSDVGRSLGRLAILKNQMRRVLLRSASEDSLQLAPDKADSLIREKGVPLAWAYVGLETGVHIGYPGKGPYPEGFDPRNRPWYRLSALTRGLHWGNPYIDVKGQGHVLPCSTSLYDESDEFLGVAGVELTFDFIIDSLIGVTSSSHVLESFLLDESGRIVVRSRQQRKTYRAGDLHGDEALALDYYKGSDVLRALKRDPSGYLETQRGEEHLLIGYYGLHVLGWSYVVEADAESVLGSL